MHQNSIHMPPLRLLSQMTDILSPEGVRTRQRLQQHEITFNHIVSAPGGTLWRAKVVFQSDSTFSLWQGERNFAPAIVGITDIIDGEPVDLWAMHRDFPGMFSTYLGSPMIGQNNFTEFLSKRACEIAPPKPPYKAGIPPFRLRVHETPISILRYFWKGCVPIRKNGARLLAALEDDCAIIIDSPEHGKKWRRRLERAYKGPEVCLAQ